MGLWRKLRQQDLVEKLQQTVEMFKSNEAYRKEELRKREFYNFPVWTRIFVIPNHPCELIMGTVVGHREICASRQLVPQYYERCGCGEWEWTQNESGTFCSKCKKTKELRWTQNPSLWNETIEEVIKDLPWWKRWNIVHNSLCIYTQEKAEHLEKHGTLANFEAEHE